MEARLFTHHDVCQPCLCQKMRSIEIHFCWSVAAFANDIGF